MRTVNYKYINEIQERVAYTKQEMINLFKYQDNYYHNTAIKAINEPNTKKQLNKILDELNDNLENREYLDIELHNVIYAMKKKHDILTTLNNYKWVWKNVI